MKKSIVLVSVISVLVQSTAFADCLPKYDQVSGAAERRLQERDKLPGTDASDALISGGEIALAGTLGSVLIGALVSMESSDPNATASSPFDPAGRRVVKKGVIGSLGVGALLGGVGYIQRRHAISQATHEHDDAAKVAELIRETGSTSSYALRGEIYRDLSGKVSYPAIDRILADGNRSDAFCFGLKPMSFKDVEKFVKTQAQNAPSNNNTVSSRSAPAPTLALISASEGQKMRPVVSGGSESGQ